jgi:hypothetical protein
VEGVGRPAGEWFGSEAGAQQGPLLGLSGQHQGLQLINLLLHRILLVEGGRNLGAEGPDLGLGISTHTWHAGELAPHQGAAHQVLAASQGRQAGQAHANQEGQQAGESHGRCERCCDQSSPAATGADCTAATRARTRSRSLSPGACSTPLEASSPVG